MDEPYSLAQNLDHASTACGLQQCIIIQLCSNLNALQINFCASLSGKQGSEKQQQLTLYVRTVHVWTACACLHFSVLEVEFVEIINTSLQTQLPLETATVHLKVAGSKQLTCD